MVPDKASHCLQKKIKLAFPFPKLGYKRSSAIRSRITSKAILFFPPSNSFSTPQAIQKEKEIVGAEMEYVFVLQK